MIETFELESGARLIFENVSHSEIVSIGFWFKNGSADENNNEKGFSHLIEHILFKGTSKKTTSEIARAFDRIGSNINAYTEKENTCFYCTFPARHIEYVIEILCDMLFNPLFDPVEIEKEKNIIISEIREYEEQPEENSYDLFLEKMWMPHPIGYKITGEAEDILKINRDSVYGYYKDRYKVSNAIITAAGNFKDINLKNLFEKNLGIFVLSNPGSLFSGRTPPLRNSSVENIYNENTLQVHFHAGIAFPSLADVRKYYQLLIFSTLAGESISSRFFQVLREEKGLCYSITSFRTFFECFSMWNIYANTVPENMNLFIDFLNIELKNIKTNYFTTNEIADAKTHLTGNIILSQEDMEARMKRIARHFIFTGNTFDYTETHKLLESISSDDISCFIDENLAKEPFNVLIYGDIESSDNKNIEISFQEG